MALYRALGFPFGRNGARDLSWFYSDRFDPKEHRKAVHEHDFRDLSKGQKLFQVLVQAIDEFFDTGRYLVFGCLFASPRPSLCPNTDPHLDQCNTGYCYSPSHGLVLPPLTL